MNIALSVVAVLLVLLVAGCGDPIQQDDAVRWTPPTVPPSPQWTDKIAVERGSGVVTAPGFNALIDAEAPAWAQSPETVVAELLGLIQGFDGPVDIHLRQEGADGDAPVLTVTLSRLGDDSIQAIRYRIVLHRADDGRFRFVSGNRTQRCQSGRGHQTFEASNCS